MQWWLVIAAFDYIALQNRKYLYVCVRQFTLRTLRFPEVFELAQDVINIWRSWGTLRTLVWLTSRSAIIWLYLHCSERWQPPLPGDLCFVSTAVAKCVWVCQTKPRSSSNMLRCVSPSFGCGPHSCSGWTLIHSVDSEGRTQSCWNEKCDLSVGYRWFSLRTVGQWFTFFTLSYFFSTKFCIFSLSWGF